MVQGTRRIRLYALLIAVCCWLPAQVAIAQQGPVAAMFASDQKREEPLALSFLLIDVPPTKTAASPLRVYLSAGDIERAFDNADFRPGAAIVPTNTDLSLRRLRPQRNARSSIASGSGQTSFATWKIKSRHAGSKNPNRQAVRQAYCALV